MRAEPRPVPAQRALAEAELAFALAMNNRPGQAQQHFDEALRLYETNGRAEHAAAINARMNRAISLQAAGQPLAALSDLEAAARAGARHSPQDEAPPYVLINMGFTLRALGRWQAAEQAYARVLHMAQRENLVPLQIAALLGLAATEMDRRELRSAGTKLDEAQSLLAGTTMSPHAPLRMIALVQTSRWQQMSGQLEAAEAGYVQARRLYGTAGLQGSAALALNQLAEIALQRGDTEAAAAHLVEALSLAKRARGGFTHSAVVGQTLTLQAEVARRRTDTAAARQLALEAIEQATPSGGPDHPVVGQARAVLAALSP